MAPLAPIIDYLDRVLRTKDIPDYPGALNGLQLGGKHDVRRVAAAVDFSAATASYAVRAEAQLLLVHHGMFWGEPQPIVGPRYEALAPLIARGIAVYSSHLPLDLHPQLGNNVLLARALELSPIGGFATFKSVEIGCSGELEIPTAALLERVRSFSSNWGGHVVASPFPDNRITRRWGICTGAGADSDTIHEATERGVDTMIVGEGPHHTAVQARDRDIVIMYAGHYATETLGVRALAERVATEFHTDWVFLDAPTGL
jgi:dinuclear metal center YbgI/SA1388 family protein